MFPGKKLVAIQIHDLREFLKTQKVGVDRARTLSQVPSTSLHNELLIHDNMSQLMLDWIS